jgi:hypothetical protein
MMIKKLSALLLIIFTLAYSSIYAQMTEVYSLGESLTYEAKYSKAILRGIPAADLSFSVKSAQNGLDFLVKSDVRSKGTLVRLFAKFHQTLESTVDGKNYSVKRTVKRDQQGERIRTSEALYDYKDNKVIYMETDPNDPMRAPRQVASPIQTDTQDLVTGIYALRRLPLAVGKSFELSISDSGLVYKIPVRVTAREELKTILGKVWCFRVEPEVFGENRLIEGKGSMILWITDDTNRMPVRARINASIGRVDIKLKKVETKPVVTGSVN